MLPAAAGDIVQAGFLRRWAAIFLDQLVLTGGLYLIMFVVFLGAGAAAGFDFDESGQPPAWMIGAYVGTFGLYYVVAALYYSLLESSVSQATLGKMALGIKVVDLDGQRLSWPHALVRWFAAGLSYLTLYIGFLAAAFTQHKQALHDLVAKTMVVDKWAYTDTPERQQHGLSGCLIAFLIFMGLFVGIAVLGILAAIAIPAYQDYTVRAKVANAVAQARTLQADVAASGACHGDSGPRGAGVARVQYEPFGSQGCQVTLWLPATYGGEPQEWVAVRRGSPDAAWTCLSSMPERQLPSTCR